MESVQAVLSEEEASEDSSEGLESVLWSLFTPAVWRGTCRLERASLPSPEPCAFCSYGICDCTECFGVETGLSCSLRTCGCGRVMIHCFICLNVNATRVCGCKRDFGERAAAMAQGLAHNPAGIQEARHKGELSILSGNVHTSRTECPNLELLSESDFGDDDKGVEEGDLEDDGLVWW